METMHVDPMTLSANERNPRRIVRSRFEELKRSLSNDPDMMEMRPLIVANDGVVVAGNMRLLAARELGWETVPVVALAFDSDDPRAIGLALRDNNHYGEWDEAMLPELLYELDEAPDIDLAATGFEEAVVNALLDAGGAGPEERPTPAVARWQTMLDPAQRDVVDRAILEAIERERAGDVGEALVAIARSYLGA